MATLLTAVGNMNFGLQIKDFITIGISVFALLFSGISLAVSFLSFRRNSTKLRVTQLIFRPTPLSIWALPNKLYLDREQDQRLWSQMPIVYLLVYLQIDNLSYTSISLNRVIINEKFVVTMANRFKFGESNLSLFHFASKESHSQDLERFGTAIPMSGTGLKKDDYNFITIGDRIEAKSTLEGVLIVKGSIDLYNAINDVNNKLEICTPDKNFKVDVEIAKTEINFDEGEKK
ncbi:TPA: hypothetical protein ACQNG4_001045 [Streptococcus pyogenes]